MSFGLSAPPVARHVAINLTTRCNQRCPFCFEGDHEAGHDLPMAEVERLLREAASIAPAVTFMGGEALLRPDILDIVRLCGRLGLRVDVFTNGQILARDGFVTALAAAGVTSLQVSFHHADAEAFAQGTGTAPRFFERLLLGLRQVRDHNRTHPEARVEIEAETVLSRSNSGRLSAIAALLAENLGESFTALRLGGLVAPGGQAPDRPLLEPLRERRAELAQLLAAWPRERTIRFTKLPLCLVPGHEHLSMDAGYLARGIDAQSNFADREALGPLHEYAAAFRTNPFRWVCKGCNLLPICASGRTTWYSPALTPARDQHPIPVRDTRCEDVLARIPEARPVEAVIGDARRWLDGLPLPELELLDALRAVADGELAVGEATCGDRPSLDVALRFRGHDLAIRLQPIHPQSNGHLQYLVRYLNVEVLTEGLPDDVVAGVLQRVAAAPLPKTSAWVGYPWFHPTLASAALVAWDLFGARLWPRFGTMGRWRTARVELEDRALVAWMRAPTGREVRIRLDT